MIAMKKNIVIAIIGVAVMFLTVSLLYAQDDNDTRVFRRPAGKGNHGAILKELNLTSEQEQKLQENRQAQRQQALGLANALKVEREKLEQAIKSYSVTRAEVEPTVTAIKSLQAQSIEQRINGIFAVKGILTPEQFAKFQELMAHKGRKMQRPAFGRQQNRMYGPGNQGE